MPLKFPKGPTRASLKRKKKRTHAQHVAEIRRQVFERERGMCRCCGVRPAESMHEIRPRSLGGKVSLENSIAVCGDGVRGCHGRLQRHEITAHVGDHGATNHIVFEECIPARTRTWMS